MQLSDTERAELRALAERGRTHKVKLLTVYRAAEDDGLTDEEAADVLGWVGTSKSWWRRCGELREDGWIERHGEERVRRGPAGPERIVCVISPAGRAVLEASGL